MSGRTILIRAEPSGVYRITVDPAPEWTSFDRERPTLHAARRYAESLKTVHGWRIVDQTGEAG